MEVGVEGLGARGWGLGLRVGGRSLGFWGCGLGLGIGVQFYFLEHS